MSKNQNYGRSMPKNQPLYLSQLMAQSKRQSYPPRDAVDIYVDKRAQEDMTVNTMDIVNLLYPINPPSRRRYPLTRCLLGYLIEFIKVHKSEDEHNFKTVVNLLSNLLQDINNPKLNGEDKLRSLDSTYYDDYGNDLDEKFINMYKLFYHYDKMDSQQYTVAGLLYDLIPLVNVSFKEIESVIKNGKTTKDIIEHKKKAAMYEDNRPLLIFYKIREIAERLFTQAEPLRQSVMQIALLQAMEKHGHLDLNFDIEQVQLYLMNIYTDNKVMNAPDIQCNNELTETIGWLFQIAESTASLKNTILNVSERIIMAKGNVEDLFGKSTEFISMLDGYSKFKDEFFF